MSRQHHLARFIRRWHARLGLTAALFFIVLAVTGVALNHTERLDLARITIQSDTLNRWYGLPPPRLLAAYPQASFVATPEIWLYQGKPLAGGGGVVVGAILLPNMLAVATPQTLVLYTHAGERIDTLRGSALPKLPIRALGLSGNALVIQTPSGFHTSLDGLTWQALRNTSIQWAKAGPPDARLATQIAPQLTPSLPLERILLDMHSGRLLGGYGPYMMDIAAIFLLVLSVSGIWIHWRTRAQKRRHPHKS